MDFSFIKTKPEVKIEEELAVQIEARATAELL